MCTQNTELHCNQCALQQGAQKVIASLESRHAFFFLISPGYNNKSTAVSLECDDVRKYGPACAVLCSVYRRNHGNLLEPPTGNSSQGT